MSALYLGLISRVVQVHYDGQPEVEVLVIRLLWDWCHQRVDHRGLVEQLATLFRNSPHALQELNLLLPSAECRVWCPLDENQSPVEVVAVICPDSSFLQTTRHDTQIPSSHIVNSLNNLRDWLMANSDWSEIFNLEPQWGRCVSELLQAELDSPQNDFEHRRSALFCLMALVGNLGRLPISYLYTDSLEAGPAVSVSPGRFSVIKTATFEGRVVCVKALSSSTSYPREQCNEALLWRQLRHPNILPLLFVVEEGGRPDLSLVSPWMENRTVLDFLSGSPQHPRLPMVTQITRGMNYLHTFSPRITHGDLKCVRANILVDDDLICRIADFGLSSVVESRHSTTTIFPGGTLRYMAPELLGLEIFPGPYDPIRLASDVYAFGCTIFELYTSHPPWALDSEEEVIRAVLAGNRPTRTQDFRTASSVWAIVESCLSKNHEHRPTSMEILEMLQNERSLLDRDSDLEERTNRQDQLAHSRPPFFINELHPSGTGARQALLEHISLLYTNPFSDISHSSVAHLSPIQLREVLGNLLNNPTHPDVEVPLPPTSDFTHTSESSSLGPPRIQRPPPGPPPSILSDSSSDSDDDGKEGEAEEDGADSDASIRPLYFHFPDHVRVTVTKPVAKRRGGPPLGSRGRGRGRSTDPQTTRLAQTSEDVRGAVRAVADRSQRRSVVTTSTASQQQTRTQTGSTLTAPQWVIREMGSTASRPTRRQRGSTPARGGGIATEQSRGRYARIVRDQILKERGDAVGGDNGGSSSTLVEAPKGASESMEKGDWEAINSAIARMRATRETHRPPKVVRERATEYWDSEDEQQQRTPSPLAYNDDPRLGYEHLFDEKPPLYSSRRRK